MCHRVDKEFLSTLSLRRATWLRCWQLAARDISIHALLAESDACLPACFVGASISIHALLAESDDGLFFFGRRNRISIHALLAESDLYGCYSLRHTTSFLSTLSLRRATNPKMKLSLSIMISIHALLAESDGGSAAGSWRLAIFLSTLSLRRATLLA